MQDKPVVHDASWGTELRDNWVGLALSADKSLSLYQGKKEALPWHQLQVLFSFRLILVFGGSLVSNNAIILIPFCPMIAFWPES